MKNANSPGPVSGDAAKCPAGTMRQARQTTSGLTIEYTLQKFSSDVSLHINLNECKIAFLTTHYRFSKCALTSS